MFSAYGRGMALAMLNDQHINFQDQNQENYFLGLCQYGHDGRFSGLNLAARLNAATPQAGTVVN